MLTRLALVIVVSIVAVPVVWYVTFVQWEQTACYSGTPLTKLFQNAAVDREELARLKKAIISSSEFRGFEPIAVSGHQATVRAQAFANQDALEIAARDDARVSTTIERLRATWQQMYAANNAHDLWNATTSIVVTPSKGAPGMLVAGRGCNTTTP